MLRYETFAQLNFALFNADVHLKSIVVLLDARISNILISMHHFFHQTSKSFFYNH